MQSEFIYKAEIEWIGNKGSGTFDYRSYGRSHVIRIPDKEPIQASSDSTFRGEKNKHNPQELFLSSISSCHMLWYLFLCAEEDIVVLEYSDNASGILIMEPDRSGYLKEIILNPSVVVAEQSMIQAGIEMHDRARDKCFLANACSIPILHKPTVKCLQ
jgi:organic hydroperoxide reductase OsmC/OhrA